MRCLALSARDGLSRLVLSRLPEICLVAGRAAAMSLDWVTDLEAVENFLGALGEACSNDVVEAQAASLRNRWSSMPMRRETATELLRKVTSSTCWGTHKPGLVAALMAKFNEGAATVTAARPASHGGKRSGATLDLAEMAPKAWVESLASLSWNEKCDKVAVAMREIGCEYPSELSYRDACCLCQLSEDVNSEMYTQQIMHSCFNSFKARFHVHRANSPRPPPVLDRAGQVFATYPSRREFVGMHEAVYRRAFGLAADAAITLDDESPVHRNMTYLQLRDQTKCRKTALALQPSGGRFSQQAAPLAVGGVGLQPPQAAQDQSQILGMLGNVLQLALAGGLPSRSPTASPSPSRAAPSDRADRLLGPPPFAEPPRAEQPAAPT